MTTQGALDKLKLMAIELAQHHLQDNPETQTAYWFCDPKGETLRLLEVTSGVTNAGEVLPIKLSAAPEFGVMSDCELILLHPEEWAMVRRGALALPADWGSSERGIKVASQSSAEGAA